MNAETPETPSLAEALRAGRPEALARVGRTILPVDGDNLVERPWGGRALFAHKGIAPDGRDVARYGEAFEVSGDPADPESAEHPSEVLFPDGSSMLLPELLRLAGESVLGPGFLDAAGPRLPILPKTLDIRELLSVQAHPPGHPEVYVVLEAEPGATVRLGFRRDVGRNELRSLFIQGRRAQEALDGLLREDVDRATLQAAIGPALARGASPDELLSLVRPLVTEASVLPNLLADLAEAYHRALDLMNAIPVRPGDVLLNAEPEARREGLWNADVHALGNPEGREIVLLEIRRPGPTYRAWDHVRFPLREIDVAATLRSLSLKASPPEAFRVQPRGIAEGILRSVECGHFTVDHLRPDREAVNVPDTGLPRTVHALGGALELQAAEAGPVMLRRGASALVPAGVTGLRALCRQTPADAVLVTVRVPEESGGETR